MRRFRIGAASSFAAILLVSVAQAAGTEQDFDLACAITSGAEIGTTQPGSEEQNAAFTINVYFLGRLSGRDPGTFWSAVVKGKVAEMREKSKSRDFYLACLDFVTKQI